MTAGKANLEFYEKKCSIYSREDLRKNTLVVTRASRKIRIGEELFVHYGDVYYSFDVPDLQVKMLIVILVNVI